ncbi:GDSL-type esterase/lipase family protein [Neptunomonas sp.]|uniref:GDSL-type esterase/lipase family protein n=1 Tax=Neptunomonas sp. TaxID=1971898 RepID=UPI0025E95D46|nr:GDSL-type esterase/lipase family protein [Neptunomonas sp.]
MIKSNTLFQIITVALITLLLNGCSDPKLEPIRYGGSILAFGDSLTLGVGTVQTNSYPSILAELSGLNVINAGISGETTESGLKRLPLELERTSPDLLILIEGGNDILQNKSESAIKANLKKMIELAQSKDISVVLIGVPQKRLFSDSAPLYQELAEEYQLVFDGTLIGNLIRSPSLKSDHVHFNAQGYRKMAESIYELLSDNGALL